MSAPVADREGIVAGTAGDPVVARAVADRRGEAAVDRHAVATAAGVDRQAGETRDRAGHQVGPRPGLQPGPAVGGGPASATVTVEPLAVSVSALAAAASSVTVTIAPLAETVAADAAGRRRRTRGR